MCVTSSLTVTVKVCSLNPDDDSTIFSGSQFGFPQEKGPNLYAFVTWLNHPMSYCTENTVCLLCFDSS